MFTKDIKVSREVSESSLAKIRACDSRIKDDDVKALILHEQGALCIYLNKDYSVEILRDTAYPKEKEAFALTIYEEGCELQSNPVLKYFDEDTRYDLGMLLGEAVGAAYNGCDDNAKSLLASAKKYVTSREAEITRRWIVECCLCGMGVLAVGFIVQFLFGMKLPYVTYGLCGGFGTAFSVLQSGGKVQFTCVAGRKLVIYEVLAKYLVGIIAAVLMILALETGIIGSLLITETNREVCYILVSVVAGFSERMVPSLLEKIEKKAEE